MVQSLSDTICRLLDAILLIILEALVDTQLDTMVEVVPQLQRVSVVPQLQRVSVELLPQLHCIWVELLPQLQRIWVELLPQIQRIWVTLTSDALRRTWLRRYAVHGYDMS
jgi:hypothetical protein